jgi:hypothetical protein
VGRRPRTPWIAGRRRAALRFPIPGEHPKGQAPDNAKGEHMSAATDLLVEYAQQAGLSIT